MGKANRIKSDLDDVSALLEIIQILKNVASNQFYNCARSKEKLEEFAISFTGFFRMVSLADARSPLVSSQVEKVAILPITSEGGFMAETTAKIIRASLAEAKKYDVDQFIVIGDKGHEKLKSLTGIKIVIMPGTDNVDSLSLLRVTLRIKDYIIEQIQQRRFGRLIAVYPRAKSLNLIKPCAVTLLPSEELLAQQSERKDTVDKVIIESNPDDIIHYLAELWLTCRIYEMLEDCLIAGFASQSQQLEASLDRLKKEKKGLMMDFHKAKKSDIDRSLREVFTSNLMTSLKENR